MVLSVESLNKKASENPDLNGEVRFDKEGKGYWFSFNKKSKGKSESANLDLNGDGKVNSEDAKIASKVMNAVRKKRSRSRKK